MISQDKLDGANSYLIGVEENKIRFFESKNKVDNITEIEIANEVICNIDNIEVAQNYIL